MIEKEDFDEWKNHKVTRAYFASLKEREAQAVEELVIAESPLLRGFILAYREMRDPQYDVNTGEFE